jgi:hypothetical protein
MSKVLRGAFGEPQGGGRGVLTELPFEDLR